LRYPVRRFRGILPPESFTIEVLGNGISGILRPSQHVVIKMFYFFSFRGLNRTPTSPVCLTRFRDARVPWLGKGGIIISSFLWTPLGNGVGK